MSNKKLTIVRDDVAQLKALLQQREDEIALMNETAAAVSSELDLEKVFSLVSHKAQELVQSETLLIAIIDEDCKEYTYRAGCGKNAEEIVGESLPLNFGVCGWVWKHKRPWWRGVLEELEEEEKNKWEKEAGTMILVPLFGKQHFLGGIVGINKISGDDFSRRDLDLLTMFGNQVSFAIENATYYEQLVTAKQKAEKYQHELQKLNTELEQKVRNRTSALEEVNDQLKHMAMHDHLTGLPNRALLQDRLNYSIARAHRAKKPLSVLMLDLDRFKNTNDTLGHHVGDVLLRTVGDRIKTLLRDSDTISRLGGDEFAIILPETDSESAKIVATRINKVIEQPVEYDGHTITTEASIGIAAYPEHNDSVTELLKYADIAMYVAKSSNSGYFVYDSRQDENNPVGLAFISDMREAFTNNKFELHYQPQISLNSNQPVRIEALARWNHEQKGVIYPEKFIPALEQTGLIKDFTYWVLDNAMNYCTRCAQHNSNVTMCVNLSMHNLNDPCLTDQILNLLEQWKLDAGHLILEITESAILHDPQQAMTTLQTLKEKGVRFSIDDFGTGYSSLAYLKKLPVAELKIDESFVAGLLTNRDDAIIVNSTIYLAHQLGLTVVAEGVEDSNILKELTNLNCDYAQGYHICPPKSGDELIAFFSSPEWLVASNK